MLKTIIVEDDLMASKATQRHASKIESLEVIGAFEFPQDAIDFCSKNTVDLILLDIQLPEMTGIELIDSLPYLPYLIFTTSREDYAYDAFQLNAAAYLKKPFSLKQLEEAVQKVLRLRQLDKEDNQVESSSIFVKIGTKTIRLNLDDIAFVESMGDYVKINCSDKSHIVHSTLKSFIDKLPPKNFLQVHRSFVINIDKIVDIQYSAVVINKSLIPISRGMKDEVMKRLNP